MALSVTTSTNTGYSGTTNTKTISSLSWSTGDIIVIVAKVEQDGATFSTPTNANLTFTSQANAAGAGAGLECRTQLWTATAGSAQSAQSISVTRQVLTNVQWGFSVRIITGSPSGVANATANLLESSQSLTVSAGSVVVYEHSDFNAAAAGFTGTTGSGSFTEDIDVQVAGAYTNWAGTWVGTSAGTFSFGTTSYTGLQVAKVLIEILDAVGGATLSRVPIRRRPALRFR